MSDWDVVGTAPAQLQNPWAVRSMAPAPTTAGDVVKGVGDAALSGASKLSTSIVAAPVALANRLVAALTGGDPQMAADAAHDYVNSHFGYDAQTPVGKKIGAAVSGALAPVGQSAQTGAGLITSGASALGIPAGETQGAMSELGDIAGTVGMGMPLAAGARASSEAATMAAQNAPAAVTKYGMRTLSDHPVAAGAAGPSGTQAVSLHNQPLGNTVLGAEAGVPHGVSLNYDSVAAGRAAPGAVYDRMENSLPTAPLSPTATAMVQKAGASENVLTQPSEATQATIEAQKQRLLGQPLTGPQVVQTGRALRQEGGTRIGSDDVEQQNLGKAQLDMANALEQHMADTLPQGADVTPEQFQAARTALAKNYAVQSALRGNNVDMQAFARMQRADPGLLTGPSADIADFANQHPAVTGLTNRIEVPPSFANDLGKSIGTGNHAGILDRLFGASGIQAGARRVLTGNSADATALAQQTPVAGLGGEFDPINAPGPQPPAGMTATSPSVPPSAPAGPPGQIPLADLLSHGVEQSPAPGLQSGPMGTPAPQGVPFVRNAAHEAGPLSLVDDLIGPSAQSVPKENNSDVAPVMSQGVPEDIMQRSRPSGGPSMPVAHSPAFISNNASAESAASQEAINRGTKPLVEVDPDGNERPILRDVTQADVNPARGHLIVDKETGTIVNSGGMAPALARGLLNRWKSMQGALGGAF